jgi:hypothetical protein
MEINLKSLFMGKKIGHGNWLAWGRDRLAKHNQYVLNSHAAACCAFSL